LNGRTAELASMAGIGEDRRDVGGDAGEPDEGRLGRQDDREERCAPQEHDVAAGGMKSGAELSDDVTLQGSLVVEVELLEGLAGGEAGGADADLTAVGLAGGNLAFEASGVERATPHRTISLRLQLL
jgi:hypothetical protein